VSICPYHVQLWIVFIIVFKLSIMKHWLLKYLINKSYYNQLTNKIHSLQMYRGNKVAVVARQKY